MRELPRSLETLDRFRILQQLIPMLKATPQKKSCFLGFLRNCSVGKSMIFFLVMLIPAEGCIAKRCFVKGYAGNQGEKIPQHWT